MKNFTQKLFAAILSAIFSLTLSAQTNVSGGIFSNTTWTTANSPYIVTSTVVVFPGFTLTIQPGVTVKFDDGQQLEIRQAQLIATGTSSAPITFTSNSSSPALGIHNGIYLNGGTIAPAFDYCNFWYADRAIYVFANYTLNITNSNFVSNNFGILSGHYANLDNCIVRSNGTGMRVAGATITNSRIVQNGTGVDLLGFVSLLKNCVVDSNQTGTYGIGGSVLKCELKYNTTAIGWNNSLTVDSCTIVSNSTGIAIRKNDVVKNCVIDSNSIDGIDNDGNDDPYYGQIYNNVIRFNGNGINETSGSPDVITKNVIEFNDIGILVRANLVYASNTGCQNIYCNKICNNTTYDLKYTIPLNTSIAGNYWCSTDSTFIATRIYDAHDNVSAGIVNFMPLDTTQCYLTTGIATNESQDFSFSIFPNPAYDNLTLTLPANSSTAEIKIFNMLGELEYASATNRNKTDIDVSNLSSGVYIIQVKAGDNFETQKFIRQ